jgi:hypothetical protein
MRAMGAVSVAIRAIPVHLVAIRFVAVHSRPSMAIRVFIELRDEHRGEINQAVLALGVGEMIAVPIGSELIRDLVNDEGGMGFRPEHRVGVVQDLAFLVLFQDAERDARDHLVAMRQTGVREDVWESGAIRVVHRDSPVIGELGLQVRAELAVELKEEEPGIRVHAADDLAGVTAFPRPVFSDDPRHGVVHFSRDAPNQRARTWDNGRNLKGIAEETL